MDVTVRKIEMFFFCRSLNQGDWSPLGAEGWLGGKECQRLRFQDFILVEYFDKGDATNTVALLLYALAK